MNESNGWISEFNPHNEFDFIGKYSQISTINKWIKESPKKALFIYGPSGVGKTEIVSFLLNKNNCNKIEINTGLIKNSIKSIKDYTKKISETNDISNYFCKQPKKTIIVIDELENLMTEKGILTEILLLLSSNFIERTPIIIISNTIDKKVSEILKKCLSVEIESPSNNDIKKLLFNIIFKKNMDIDDDAVNLIIDKVNNDFRRLINIMYELYLKFGENTIKKIKIISLLNTIGDKNIDMNLSQITNKIITKKINVNKILKLYDTDKLLISLMIHENYIKQLTSISDDFNTMLNNISEISYNISLSEMYEKMVYNHHTWELYNCSGIHSCVLPNYILNKEGNNKQVRKILFTNYLSKSSTFTSKRKIENYYFDLFELNYSLSFVVISDLIISAIFNKNLFGKCISFLKLKGFKFDDFDKIYKHASIKDTFKKSYSTKFKKLLKEKLL
jgi:DNA polymerase III delta prime subunit